MCAGDSNPTRQDRRCRWIHWAMAAPLSVHVFWCNNLFNGPLSVWPDWVIYWTLGNFLKPLATIHLPKSPIFLGNFCKGVKIVHFSSEIIFGNFYRHLLIFSGHSDLFIVYFRSFQKNISIFTILPIIW